MELVLYTYKEKYNPLSHLCKIWCKLYNITLHIEESSYNWCSIGDLPVLRFNQYLFPSESIAQVLHTLFDIDHDFSQSSSNAYKTLEEYCVNKLHQATQYAIWIPSDTSKYFTSMQSSYFAKLLNILKLPYLKKEKSSSLKDRYGIASSYQAFQVAHEAHILLSQVLGERKYFSSEHSITERPHGIDLIVYVYLFEELCNLSGNLHVEDSLRTFPNLIRFMESMREEIEQEHTYSEHLKIKVEENWLKGKAFKSGRKFEAAKNMDKASSRQTFVTIFAGVILTFLWVNGKR